MRSQSIIHSGCEGPTVRYSDRLPNAATRASAWRSSTRVGPIGLSPLTRRLELPKTVTFRLLKTLQEQGYVSQDPITTRYQLTFRMLMIGSSIRQKIDLHQCAQPVLERLVTDTRETAHVGVLDDIYMIPIQKVESPEALRADVPMGRRWPAFCSALGKAILAFLPTAEPSV